MCYNNIQNAPSGNVNYYLSSYNLATKEFYKNGEWINDKVLNRHLTDAMMDYGDWSPSDYDDITEEEAMNLIKNK